MGKWGISLLLLCGLLMACSGSNRRMVGQTLTEWIGKEIFYPSEMNFTLLNKDVTENYLRKSSFTILNYVDSTGCTRCKLQLSKWKAFISDLDSVFAGEVQVLFFVHPKKKEEIEFFIERDMFKYPIIFDVGNHFYSMNQLPNKSTFHCFLLNCSNRVLAVGNPIHNHKIRELYLKIIRGDKVELEGKNIIIRTEVSMDKTIISLGDFDWQKEQKATFFLKNTGNKPLVVEHVNTSCGCTSVSYSKEPVQPGKDIALEVTYKADQPEHFNKTITVYCNAGTSPVTLKISGNAK